MLFSHVIKSEFSASIEIGLVRFKNNKFNIKQHNSCYVENQHIIDDF